MSRAAIASVLIAAAAIGLPRPAVAAEGDVITGTAAVIDGDTIAIGDSVIRLFDVDAPEMAQTCEGGPSRLRACGAYVAGALAERLADREIRCEVLKVDQYHRQVARCELYGEVISQWLVANGLAMVFRRYSDRFIDDEEAARAAGLGLWQTGFEPPWEYRAKRWEVATQEAPGGCPIKGNINHNGQRIYHTPWGSEWYAKTRINTAAGERWFCDEREALDAGWRAPQAGS
jgi:endonuclease YncB( thermonuclease family)